MNLQARVTNILTKPKTEWPVIAAEPETLASLYTNYIMLLAAIPAVCSFIGMTVIGVSIPGFGGFGGGRYRVPFVGGFVNMIVSYVFALAGVYISALVIEKLAPNFQSRGDTVQALKLVAYASTPMWLAGVLMLFPPLAPLTLLAGLYGIYLFYLGLPPLMQTPQDKVIPYMVVAAVVVIVVTLLMGLVSGLLGGAFYARPTF